MSPDDRHSFSLGERASASLGRAIKGRETMGNHYIAYDDAESGRGHRKQIKQMREQFWALGNKVERYRQ